MNSILGEITLCLDLKQIQEISDLHSENSVMSQRTEVHLIPLLGAGASLLEFLGIHRFTTRHTS